MRSTLLVIFIFFSLFSYAQKAAITKAPSKLKAGIVVTEATSQRWSGGIAGSMGYRYNITFEVSPNGNIVRPDTIWIGSRAYPVHTYEGEFPTGQDVNCKLTKGKTKWVYAFYINAAEPNTYSNQPDIVQKKKEEIQPKALDYKGAAAITYTYNHKRKLKTIPSFKQLAPLNYP